MKRELVYMDAKSSKFWNIELKGNSYTVTYGRIGT
ncbi:MAG TPA: WGR domain-containing protein, partial [Clostridia bacterium]|nr:WGR domain-containing protein [Clostridia bacterium]